MNMITTGLISSMQCTVEFRGILQKCSKKTTNKIKEWNNAVKLIAEKIRHSLPDVYILSQLKFLGFENPNRSIRYGQVFIPIRSVIQGKIVYI